VSLCFIGATPSGATKHERAMGSTSASTSSADYVAVPDTMSDLVVGASFGGAQPGVPGMLRSPSALLQASSPSSAAHTPSQAPSSQAPSSQAAPSLLPPPPPQRPAAAPAPRPEAAPTPQEQSRSASLAAVSDNPRDIAQALAQTRGWTGAQWTCLDKLWDHESKYETTVRNPRSGAYGIPQALPGSKMASAGADWRTNPVTQIMWGLDYISGRYGTPCGAWSYWLGHYSY
jgi:hypothetical protein